MSFLHQLFGKNPPAAPSAGPGSPKGSAVVDRPSSHGESAPIARYCDEVVALLSDRYTGLTCSLPDWERRAQGLVRELAERWKNGDENALSVMQKIIRYEFDAPNLFKESLQDMVLSAMRESQQLAVGPLLSMLRDDTGAIVFEKDLLTYLRYPRKILGTLKDVALAGGETTTLVYEFIRMGAKLAAEIPNYKNSRDQTCGYALFNIRETIFNSDDTALLAALPALGEDEKQFLIDRGYNVPRQA